jgi:hypothetical protein
MADATASATTINWFSALSDLMRKMFLLEDIDAATIDRGYECDPGDSLVCWLRNQVLAAMASKREYDALKKEVDAAVKTSTSEIKAIHDKIYTLFPTLKT